MSQKYQRLYFCFVFLFWAWNSYAQKATYFQTIIKSSSGVADAGYDIIQLANRDFMVAGGHDVFPANGNSTSVVVSRTDSLGRVLWTKTYESEISGNDQMEALKMIVAPDSNIVILAGIYGTSNRKYTSYLIKIDQNGKLLWARTIESGHSINIGYGIVNAPGGGFILSGETQPIYPGGNGADAMLIKTNDTGGVVWYNSYGRDIAESLGSSYFDFDCIYNVCPAQDGSYLVCGTVGKEVSDSSLDLLMKVDKNGKLIWYKEYYGSTNNDYLTSVFEMPDGSIYGYGYSLNALDTTTKVLESTLIKFDSSGNLLWAKNYGNGYDGNNTLGSTICYDPVQKCFYIAASSFYKNHGLINMKLDTSGKVLHFKEYDKKDDWYLYSMILLARGDGTAIVGFIEDTTNYEKQNLFFAKTDTAGNSNSCSTVSSTFYTAPISFVASSSPMGYLSNTLGDEGSGSKTNTISFYDSSYCAPFITDFRYQNNCLGVATQFFDSSYEYPAQWKWDFGDPVGSSTTNADTSSLQNPIHTYKLTGTYTVRLISGNGTVTDTMIKKVTIFQSPTPFSFDTLICGGSTIKLRASGASNYFWLPGKLVSDSTAVNPITKPGKTTTFIVLASYNNTSCVAHDTLHVTVDNRPAPPVVLLTTVKSEKEIDVLFQKSDSNDVKSYGLYRSTNGGAYQKLGSFVNLSDTNKSYFYADTTVKADSNHYAYKVVAADSCGGGIDTSIAYQPVLLKGSAGELHSVLNWTTYLGYAYDTAVVQRYDTLTHKWINLAYLSNKDSAYTDSSYLKCNKTVYYRLATYLNDSQVSYSDSIQVTPYETVFKDTPQIVTVSKISTSTNNGSVVIKWTNNNIYVFYNQLYYSADGNIFNLLKDSLPVGQDSFVHTGVNTQSADQYYYIIGVDSCPAKSPKSIIHKTITLTVSIGELLHKLNWTPYQGFNVEEYKIEKLVGTSFVAIDSVPGNDTSSRYFPAPCNHVERYMIEAVGYNPGEISYSDSMGRKALDTIPPDAPIIKNASAINDTSARLDFKGSDSLATYKFVVQRSVNGNWGTLGDVLFTHPGQAATYIDSNINTVKNHVCYTVIAIDSCLNSTPGDTFCLINLQGKGVQMADSLHWSPFVGYTISNYYVLRYLGPNNWDTVGIVSGSDTQYLHKPLSCNVPQTYKIVGFEKGGTEKTFSDSIILTPFDTIKPPAPTIKYATILNGSHIQLFWHKSIPEVKLYELSMRTGNGNWSVTDSVKVDTSFIFSGLNTTDSVYDFRIVAIDSCAANRSGNSQYHSAAFLSGIALDDTVKLNWKPYEGFASVKEYYIYTRVNGQWSVTDSVGGNTDTWISNTLPCNVPQAYKIGALDNTGKYLSYSDTIQITPFDTIKPPAPQLYYATVLPNQTVKLSWQWHPENDVKYFEIWRSTNKAAPVLIDTVIYDSVFIDTSVNVKSNVYSYSIIAIDSCNTANRSKPSKTDSLIELSLYSLYCSPQVQVNWTSFAGLPDGASSYNILRSTDGVNFTSIGSVSPSTTVFTDNSVTIDKQYYYKTEAIDSKSGYVSYSDTLGILPRLIPLADSAQLVYATVLKSDETNGEIYIQWKRALKNDTNARGYYVYSFNTVNGKYALIKDVTDLSDTSYIQNNINTLQNAFKYYIVTYNVCDVGINSKIHKTVLLKVQNQNLSSSLKWTNYFGIPIKSYSVYKSKDGGPQNLVFNAGLDSAYLDSNITCNHNFTYQIQAILANGEISFSDSITVKSFDTIRPKTKPVILATVTKTGIKDGRILLSWNAATDNNLEGYNIYRSSDGIIWQEIRQGFVGLSLTDTGLNTFRQAYYYKIQPFDSCGNTGPFTIYHTTMQLTASAGNGFNHLSWNGYAGWGVEKYLVYKNGALIDTLANNVFSFKDTAVICQTTYQYLVKAIDSSNDTIISASNTDSAKALNHIPPQKVYIKTVTISKPNKAATISWTPSSSYDVKNYFIYRKSAATGAMVFVDSTINLNYIDSSEAITQPDCYYVFARDHCGNQSDGSNQGCIITLTAKSQPGYNDVSWNSYQTWYDGVQSYNVYKNEDSTGWQLIGTTSSVQINQFKDSKLGDSTIDFCYQVEAIENPGQYNQLSRSTVECVHQDATVFIPNTFTPYDQDGLNDLFSPIGVYVKSYSMKIYNRWGELLYNTNSSKPWDGNYKGQFVQQGVYIYLITVTDYNGKQSYFKGTITMFE